MKPTVQADTPSVTGQYPTKRFSGRGGSISLGTKSNASLKAPKSRRKRR